MIAWDGFRKKAEASTVRKLVKLRPGEVAKPDLLVAVPQGYRLETDEEFRVRIIAATEASP
jgi:hypothetical protein